MRTLLLIGVLLAGAPLAAAQVPEHAAQHAFQRGYFLAHGQRDPAKAIEQFAEAIKLAPAGDHDLVFRSHVERARCHETLGQWESAQRDWQTAQRLKPDDAVVKKALGILQARLSGGALPKDEEAAIFDLIAQAGQAMGRNEDPSATSAWTKLQGLDASALPILERILDRGTDSSTVAVVLACMDRRPLRPLPEVWPLLAKAMVKRPPEECRAIVSGLGRAMLGLEYDRISALGADGFAGLLSSFAREASEKRVDLLIAWMAGGPRLRVNRQFTPRFWDLPLSLLAPDSQDARALVVALRELMEQGRPDQAFRMIEMVRPRGKRSAAAGDDIRAVVARALAESSEPGLSMAGALGLAGRMNKNSGGGFRPWSVPVDDQLGQHLEVMAARAIKEGVGRLSDAGYRVLSPPGLNLEAGTRALLRAEVERVIANGDYRSFFVIGRPGYSIPWSAEELLHFYRLAQSPESRLSVQVREEFTLRLLRLIWAVDRRGTDSGTRMVKLLREAKDHSEALRIGSIILRHSRGPMQTNGLAAVRGPLDLPPGVTWSNHIRGLIRFCDAALSSRYDGLFVNSWKVLHNTRAEADDGTKDESLSAWVRAERRRITREIAKEEGDSHLPIDVRRRAVMSLPEFAEKSDAPIIIAGMRALSPRLHDMGPCIDAVFALTEDAEVEAVHAAIRSSLVEPGHWLAYVSHAVGDERFGALIDVSREALTQHGAETFIKCLTGLRRWWAPSTPNTWKRISVKRGSPRAAAVAHALRLLSVQDWNGVLVKCCFEVFERPELIEWLKNHFDALAEAEGGQTRSVILSGIQKRLLQEAGPILLRSLESGDSRGGKEILQTLDVLSEAAEARRRFEHATSAVDTKALVQRIQKLLREGSVVQKLGAVHAAASLPKERAMPILLGVLEGDDEALAAAASAALEKLR